MNWDTSNILQLDLTSFINTKHLYPKVIHSTLASPTMNFLLTLFDQPGSQNSRMVLRQLSYVTNVAPENKPKPKMKVH